MHSLIFIVLYVNFLHLNVFVFKLYGTKNFCWNCFVVCWFFLSQCINGHVSLVICNFLLIKKNYKPESVLIDIDVAISTPIIMLTLKIQYRSLLLLTTAALSYFSFLISSPPYSASWWSNRNRNIVEATDSRVSDSNIKYRSRS